MPPDLVLSLANSKDPDVLNYLLQENELPDDYEARFDVVVENQRGLKLFGIGLFSRKSLFPLVDPSPYTRLDGSKVTLPLDTLESYPIPDLGWEWRWPRWYVLMQEDVDESGWMYLSLFWSMNSRWHGKYYFGDFVRRRLWVRVRSRKIDNTKDDVEESEPIRLSGDETVFHPEM